MKEVEKMKKPEILKELKGHEDKLEDFEFSPEDSVSDLKETLLDARKALSEDTEDEEENTEEEEKITPETEAPEKKEEVGDYLKQYEYQKASGHPYAKSAAMGFPYSAPTGRALVMKNVLLKQPRIRTSISRNQGEHKSILQSICLNGYRLDFPKNSALQLPEQIVETLEESQEITEHASDNMPTRGIE